MTSEQRCGTCRWAEKVKVFGHRQLRCRHVVPACVIDRVFMLSDDGTKCPCYQPAQQPETTETKDDA